MKTGVIQLMMSGQLRPRRTYDGLFVASKCGRFLRRIGGGEKGALAGPGGVVCSDPELAVIIERNGYKVARVKSFERAELKKALAACVNQGSAATATAIDALLGAGRREG